MKKILKKTAWLLLSLCLLVFVSACVKAGNEKETGQAGTQLSDELKQKITNISEQLSENLFALDDEQFDKNIDSANKGGEKQLADSLNNFKMSRKEIGDLKTSSMDTAVITEDEDSYTFSIEVTGTERKANLKISYNKELSNIKLISLNPEYSISEKLSKAGLNTFIGMGTVFVILIFIIMLISLFKYISIIEKKFAKTYPIKETPEEVTVSQNDLMKDEELVAVITAAIAAYEEQADEVKGDDVLIVISLKRKNRKNNF